MVEFNGRLDALPCRLITALFFVAQIVYSHCAKPLVSTSEILSFTSLER